MVFVFLLAAGLLACAADSNHPKHESGDTAGIVQELAEQETLRAEQKPAFAQLKSTMKPVVAIVDTGVNPQATLPVVLLEGVDEDEMFEKRNYWENGLSLGIRYYSERVGRGLFQNFVEFPSRRQIRNIYVSAGSGPVGDFNYTDGMASTRAEGFVDTGTMTSSAFGRTRTYVRCLAESSRPSGRPLTGASTVCREVLKMGLTYIGRHDERIGRVGENPPGNGLGETLFRQSGLNVTKKTMCLLRKLP